MVFIENFMISSVTEWMCMLPASDQKQALCTCSALKLLESAGFIAYHNATFSSHFRSLLGHSRVIVN